MSNEAADRLRQHMRTEFYPPHLDDVNREIDAALAAERRATVERIRALPTTLRAKGWYIVDTFDKTFDAILDAEAAR